MTEKRKEKSRVEGRKKKECMLEEFVDERVCIRGYYPYECAQNIRTNKVYVN